MYTHTSVDAHNYVHTHIYILHGVMDHACTQLSDIIFIPHQCPISLDTPVPLSSQNEDCRLILSAQVTHAAPASDD